jgi:hypothetical protein
MTTVFAVLTACIVAMQLTKHWFLSEGRLKTVYYLNMAIFIGYFITETAVALNDPAQWPLFFMNIVNVFAFFMAVKGMKRLKRESALEENLAATIKEGFNNDKVL